MELYGPVINQIIGHLKPDYSTARELTTIFPQVMDRHLYFYFPCAPPYSTKTTLSPTMTKKCSPPRVHRPTQPTPSHFLLRHPSPSVLPVPLDNRTLRLLRNITLLLPIFPRLQSIGLCLGTLSWNTYSSSLAFLCTPMSTSGFFLNFQVNEYLMSMRYEPSSFLLMLGYHHQ